MSEFLVVTADALNVRDAPSIRGGVVRILEWGATVELLGTSGDEYWKKIGFDGISGWASHKYLRPASGATASSRFPWYSIAQGEIGVKEVAGSGDNPRILEYLRSTNLAAPMASHDETPWCSAFANWCVEKSGFAGTDSAWARSWLNWGKSTESPEAGCIVVFSREESSGHVGFYVSENPTSIHILGGNMSNQVGEDDYPRSRLLGFRVPR